MRTAVTDVTGPGWVPLAGGAAVGLPSAWLTAGLPGLPGPGANGGLVAVLAVLGAGTLLAGLRWRAPAAMVSGLVVLVLLLGFTTLAEGTWAGAALGVLHGLGLAACLVVPVLVGDAARRRRAHVQRGWDLADAESRAQEARLERTLTLERAAMAREMHDALGHRLTLIAMRAGRLALDPELSEAARVELRGIRAASAEAAGELGEAVRLLGRQDVGDGLSGRSVRDLLDDAAGAGLQVDLTGTADLEDQVSGPTRAALLRVVREGLTNAGRHGGPGRSTVDLSRVGADVGVQVVSPGAAEAPTAPPGQGGTGLAGLRYRVEALGGRLATHRTAERFVLRARVPAEARPEPDRRPAIALAQERDRSQSSYDRARRRVWWVPAVLAGAALVVAVGFFVITTALAVLGTEDAAGLRVGMDRVDAERVLPALEMLDAPRDALPAPTGADCRFYETTVSFFERDDVVRVCLDDTRVVSVDTIPAP